MVAKNNRNVGKDSPKAKVKGVEKKRKRRKGTKNEKRTVSQER